MNDVHRYRMNAAECLSAAERCGPAYRNLTVSIAETWLALARHQEAMDELLATWGTVQAAAPARLPSSNLRDPSRGWIIAFQAREAISA
jgi:hypothetical protein